MTNIQKIIEETRDKWRGYAIVDNSFENMDISINAEKIADWWLIRMQSSLHQIRQETLEDIINLIQSKK